MSKSSNGYGAGEENGTKVKEPETVTAAKNAFNQYFEMAGRKSFMPGRGKFYNNFIRPYIRF